MTVHRHVSLLALFVLTATPLGLSAQDLPSLEDLDREQQAAETQTEETPTEEAPEPTDGFVDVEASDAETDSEQGPEPASSGAVQDEHAADTERDERFVSPMLNLDGTVGLQNIAAAYGGHANTYRIALLGQFFSGNDTVRFNDSNTFFAGNLLIEASPIDYFSAHLKLQTRSNVNTFGRPEAMLSQGDLQLGFKGYWHPSEGGLYVGGDLTLHAPADFGGSGLNFDGLSIRPRILASFDFAELTESEVNLRSHVNIAYTIDRSENLVPSGVSPTRVERFAYGLRAYDSIDLGVGFEYDAPYVSPFVEWNFEIPVNGADGICQQANLDCASTVGAGSFPHVLSLGLKGEPVEHLGAHLGLDIGLTSNDAAGLPVTPPWQLVFGLQWTIDPTPKIEYVEQEVEVDQEAPEAFVQGTVVDKDTKEPIPGVVIRYPLGDDTPQATREDGTFRSYGFAPGSQIRFILSHPRYEEMPVSRRLPEEPGDHPLEVEMTALDISGQVTGRVVDEEGAPIEGANIRLSGAKTFEATTDSSGNFNAEVDAGDYEIAARAEGYLTRGKSVSIDTDDPTSVNFELKAAPEESLVELRDDRIEIQQKVFFDSGKATIQQRSFGLLEQVTALLAENPQVKKVRIEGHTDDVGSDDFNLELSQDRAEAVRNFLVEQGISPERLEAQGFGSGQPLLPNTSNRNRTINRRVEFSIPR